MKHCFICRTDEKFGFRAVEQNLGWGSREEVERG